MPRCLKPRKREREQERGVKRKEELLGKGSEQDGESKKEREKREGMGAGSD